MEVEEFDTESFRPLVLIQKCIVGPMERLLVLRTKVNEIGVVDGNIFDVYRRVVQRFLSLFDVLVFDHLSLPLIIVFGKDLKGGSTEDFGSGDGVVQSTGN